MDNRLDILKSSRDKYRFRLHCGNTLTVDANLSLTPAQIESQSLAVNDFLNAVASGEAKTEKLRQLGKKLFKLALPDGIQQRLSHLDGPLTISTDYETLPWEILHDGTEFLALKYPTARQLPDRNAYDPLLRPREVFTPNGFSALVIANPTEDIERAHLEGENLSRLFQQWGGECTLLLGREADYDRITTCLLENTYSVIHICAHIDFTPASGESSIRLRDGRRLLSQEVRRLVRGSPLVFLNTCYSDVHPRPGAKTRSFAQSCKLGGEEGRAAVVVGTMWRIPARPREAGWEISHAFYNHLKVGGGVGEALLQGRTVAREKGWGPMVWGSYVLYGDPCWILFPSDMTSTASNLAAASQDTATQAEFSASKDSATITVSTVEDQSRTLSRKMLETAKDSSTLTGKQLLEELSKASPLDNDARYVLDQAYYLVTKLEHSGLSTMHLLSAFCNTKVPALMLALEKKGVDAGKVVQEAEQRAEGIFALVDLESGLSANVTLAFLFAAVRAAEAHRDIITSEDMLSGVLECESSQAVDVLREFGITKEDIFPLITITHSEFTEESWSILVAASEAADARHESLGTPCLYDAMLFQGGRLLARGIQRLGFTSLPTFGTSQPCQQPLPETVITPLSENVRTILNMARLNRDMERRAKVGEMDLLHAFVQHQGGRVGAQLMAMGVVLEDLVSVFLEDGYLDLSRFDKKSLNIIATSLDFVCRKRQALFGRRHLLYGFLVQEGGILAEYLVEQNLSARALADYLYSAMCSGDLINVRLEAKDSDMSPDLIQVFLTAARSGNKRDDGKISEKELLQAWLEDGGGASGQVLVSAGVDMQRLRERLSPTRQLME